MWLKDRNCEEVWNPILPGKSQGMELDHLWVCSNVSSEKISRVKRGGGGGGVLGPIQTGSILSEKKFIFYNQGNNVCGNTTYFHYRATQRNQQNLILGLENDDGVWVEDEVEMGDIATKYFKDIFASSNPSGFESILNGIQSIVGADLEANSSGDF